MFLAGGAQEEPDPFELCCCGVGVILETVLQPQTSLAWNWRGLAIGAVDEEGGNDYVRRTLSGPVS